MEPLLFALCVVFVFDGLSEQKPAWQPAPGHTEIAIWPGAAPDPQPVAGPEYAETSGKDFLPGGRPAVGVSNVTRPTITVYSPQGKNTGLADAERNHVCPVEIPRDGCGTVSEIGAISRITDGVGRCAEGNGASAFSRAGVAH